MIHSISSNNPSFREVQFDKGLNVVIAKRKETSGVKKTTNSTGKSTLIAIINFCLGSNSTKSSLNVEELFGWNFTMDITLLGNRVQVTREIDNPSKFFIDGDTGKWVIEPDFDEETKKRFVSLDKWKQILGLAFFDLPQQANGISIRSLLSYFLRSGNVAYSKPLKFYSAQADNIAHVYSTFFVGLDHRYANKWCELDQQNKALKAIDAAAKVGVYETQGELEARKVELEEELKRSRKILKDFKVHEKYKEIQDKANQLTDELHHLANKNISENQKLRHYENAVSEEKPPEKSNLEAVYNEIGLVFPDLVKYTLKEASVFHNQIIKNRANFLNAEIVRIKNDIAQRRESIKTLTDKRASCMEILKTHGALEEYSRLQEENTKIKEKHEKILNKIEDIRYKSKKLKEIKSSKLELDKDATIDYEEKRELWEKAIKLFNESAKALYGVAGEFVIDISEKGYRFKVDIPGGRGGGIGKMKIFCYDLMVICMQKILKRNIDFLVHDSTIYEGVDERQIAHAIEQGAEKASEYNFQYIMAINSDMVPYNDFHADFNFDNYIKLKLSDEDVSGSLLGIRF